MNRHQHGLGRGPDRARLWALVLVPALALGCKNKGEQASAPELELPPDKRVADRSGSDRDGPPEPPGDDKVAAAKVEPEAPGKPEVVTPQDRDPNQEKAKMKRSRELSAQAKQQLRAGQTDQAIRQARSALKEHEQNVEAMLVIAEAFYKQGKHELVQSVTGSILKVDPKILTPEEKSQAYNLMGFAYLQAGKRIDAFTSFKNAAETDANNASAWNNLGVQYMWRGDPKTAESCFEYAVSLDAKFADAQLNWGAALRANGKLAEAEAAFRQAAKLRPDWAEVEFNLGVLYLDAEQLPNLDETAKLEAAIDAFERYKQLVSKSGAGATATKKKRGPSDPMGNELVSIAQADLYIKAANKGIESEERRKEREQKRKEREADSAEAEEPDPSEASDAPSEPEPEPEPAQPQPPAQQPPAQQPPAQQPPAQQPPAQQPPAQQPPAQPSQPSQPSQPAEKPAEPPASEKPQAPQKPQPQKPKPQKPGG